MKKKFSTKWKASKQPRKQKKYSANAPLHLKKKLVSANISKELRKKYGKRSIPVRKGDVVKIMRGKFKGKKGKVTEVRMKYEKIIVEGIQVKKQEGSKVNFPLRASNLQITEINLDDKKRIKIQTKPKVEKTQEKPREEKK
jgi:large subunit ribosomal protein L24